MLAAATVIVPLAGTAVTAPTPLGQLVVMFGTDATTKFVGKVSRKPMPDCAGLGAPLTKVKVNVLVPP